MTTLNLPKFSHLSGRLRDLAPLVVLVVLVLAVAARQPAFLGQQSLTVLADQAVPILLLGLAQMVVILTGGIDLSAAALASLSSVVYALTVPDLGPLALLVTLLAVTAAGVVNGLLVSWGQAPSFIITLGTFGAIGALSLQLSGASTIYVQGDGFRYVRWLSEMGIGGISSGVLLSVVVVAIVWAIMRFSPSGRSLHLIGLNERAAIMSGIPVRALRVLAFGLSGLFSGLAGIVLVAQQQSAAPQLADSLLLPGIAAAVVGGCAITGGIGNAWGLLVGALTISVLRVGSAVAGIDPNYQQIMYGLVVVVAVAVTLDRSRLNVIK
jgi:ribose transport system permease protein